MHVSYKCVKEGIVDCICCAGGFISDRLCTEKTIVRRTGIDGQDAIRHARKTSFEVSNYKQIYTDHGS